MHHMKYKYLCFANSNLQILAMLNNERNTTTKKRSNPCLEMQSYQLCNNAGLLVSAANKHQGQSHMQYSTYRPCVFRCLVNPLKVYISTSHETRVMMVQHVPQYNGHNS
jgi:hypothetical protein